MNRETTIIENSIEMVSSLLKSIDDAGGYIPWKELKNMTVLELVSKLATNKIRFCCEEDNISDVINKEIRFLIL